MAVPCAMLQAARRWGPWPPSLAVWRTAHTGQSAQEPDEDLLPAPAGVKFKLRLHLAMQA